MSEKSLDRTIHEANSRTKKPMVEFEFSVERIVSAKTWGEVHRELDVATRHWSAPFWEFMTTEL